MTVATLLIALVLAAVHVFGDRIADRLADSHHRWLSVGAGVTVAFIFLYLLPELDYFRRILEDHPATAVVDELLYLAALVGVTIYYGLEHLAHRVRSRHLDDPADDSPFGHDYVFWMHMGWYAVYNVIIGALLMHGEQETIHGLALYAVAMAMHFATVDAALRRHHLHVYHTTGRWVLAAAMLAGWAAGSLIAVSPAAIALMVAFVAGGLLINAIKDELPRSERAHFLPFLGGVVGFSVILIVL